MAAVSLRQVRLILWVLVAVAAIGATVLFVFAPPRNPAVADIGGGQYQLVNQRGEPVDQRMLEGHPSLLFFGYTHCPDVCPTTMAEIAGWYEQLGAEAGTLQAFFVTVDPERDTPDMLDSYVSWVSDKVTGVTGERAEINKMMQAWRAVGEKVPGTDGEYTMNHTASIYLVNSEGEFEGTIAYGEESAVALEKIKRLVAEG